jgi:SMC interacting uncharacterized protein involved in chromosome segregation
MSSKRSPSYRTSDVDHKKSINEAEEATRGLKDSVSLSLRAAAEPIVQMPNSLKTLQEQGRSGDVKKILALGTTIAQDFDKFSAERAELDTEFDKIVNNPPAKKKDLSKHHMDLTMTGLKYIDLNDRITSTLSKSASDYEEILNKPAEPANV